jgi:L-proline---[L-prolyl-carrier protein] ligase
VASIFGTLGAGAVYVPLDPSSPPERRDFVLRDSGARVMLGERSSIEDPHPDPLPPLHTLPSGEGATSRPAASNRRRGSERVAASDPAYILYTSGSTGRPKGVLHTHASALSFLDWAAAAFAPAADERFSSHAPIHFDLSILDLFLPIARGATVVLIGEELGRDPRRLAPWIAEQRITSWYSTPSILRLLVQYGRMDRHQYPALRRVLFAGEVFPIRALQALRKLWPGPRYFNLYGPTETNVCTFHELPPGPWDDRDEPFPIGVACSGCRTRIADAEGGRGELLVAGGSVMAGYWNRPRQAAESFLADAGGTRWYQTGDLVWEDGDGNLRFAGRRDRMVKRFGNRVELGEIEAALHRHPAVAEAALVAVPDDDSGVLLRAFLHCPEEPPSRVEIKTFCAGLLPAYMVPDTFLFGPPLPKTSTGKTDYQALCDDST